MSDERITFDLPHIIPTTITMFPPELLTNIFYFVGPSSLRNPYPYLPLRLVCHRWRDIILNDSRFWTVLYFDGTMRPPFDLHNEVIHRNNSHGLDIFLSLGGIREHETTRLVSRVYEFIRSNSLHSRIKTLLLLRVSYHYSFTMELFAKCSSPQLERLTGTLNLDERLLIKLIVNSRLRYAELPWSILLALRNQNLLHHLSHIELLKLGKSDLYRADDSALLQVHDILENIPNLQVLILSWKKQEKYKSDNEPSRPVITLPKLRLLSLDFDHQYGDLWTFRAPNLDYLSVVDLGTRCFHNWKLLSCIDFSKINSVLIKIDELPTEDPVYDEPGIQRIACISGSEHTLLDCSVFEDFHRQGLESRVAVNDYLELPPKNCFHIPISWTLEPKKFYDIMGLTTNLVELTLNYGAFKNGPSFFFFLSRILSRACTKITQLNVVQGRSFVEACALLKNGLIAPRLERLMYQNASKLNRTAFIPRRVKALQDARLKAGSQPLKILDVRNIANIPPARVQEIEDLGVQLIQTNNNF